MYIQQLYTGCLSEAAYYIESNGEAAIVDPLRDIDAYLQLAAERNTRIKYIFETHFHADFVSGHIDLAKATGATIIYGPQTETKLPVHIAADGEQFAIGDISITVLHTPGHTLESSCYLLKDATGKEHCVFTGDTLFVGDVGRPDLAQKGADLTMEELAGMLYDSLQKHILTRPDDVIVYPAHGAGSACGKSLGPETFSTIGEQKANNYALQPQSKAEFVRAVTDGLSAPPQYFPINARINKEGYEDLDSVLAKGMKALSVREVREALDRDVLVLDTRHATEFSQGFVPGSVFIGLEGRFAEWAGSLLPYTGEMLLVTEPGKERETLMRLARVGFQNMIGYLEGGFESWKTSGEAIDLIVDVEPDELAMDLPFDENIVVLDVRKPSEFAEGHVKDAINIPLNDMTDPLNLARLEEEQNLYVHCLGGYRSLIAASLLKRQGIHNLRNVLGGWNAIKKEEKIPTEKEKSVLN
ncbi:MAG: MBL fold metallo-hydrolase [Chitinophagaceae bacterium]|nr:MAG: MBL fold metallo-hydrolase [Chitinophagaceae bacterium]